MPFAAILMAICFMLKKFFGTLEEDMIPLLAFVKTSWLESHFKNFHPKYKESNVCVAGEIIKADVEFKNPLQISRPVCSVSLIYSSSSTHHDELRKLGSDGKFCIDVYPFVLSEVDLLQSWDQTVVAQVTIVPKIKGTLEIDGVRWKLSGLVAGLCKFGPDLSRKEVARGRRKSRESSSNCLWFLVIKNFPKLEGVLNHLPKILYAGDTWLWDLELRNSSSTPLKVFPSLDVSFQIRTQPLWLQEFIVRMNAVNRMSSESFQFYQLSSVGNEWEISLLQPTDTTFPSEFLVAGQALSCFFELKNCRMPVNPGSTVLSFPPGKADIRFGDESGKASFGMY